MAYFEKEFHRVRSYIQKNIYNDEAKFYLRKLINHRDYKDDYGLTLLHYSVMHGNTEMVKFLIEWGCNVNVRDKYGTTPLMIATKITVTKAVELLLKSNADMYLDNNGESSFHSAAQRRLVESTIVPLHDDTNHILYKFVEKAIEDFSTNKPETIPSLLRAGDLVKLALVVFGSVEIANFLLENGYAVDFCETKRNFTALHWAVFLGKRENVKILMKYGAKVNCLDTIKLSPLYYYLDYLESADEQSEVLTALVTASLTTANQDDFVQGEIEYLLHKGKKETVRAILKSGIEMVHSMSFSGGRSYLHVLVENKDDDVIDLLDELGIEFDVNARTESQETALMMATCYGSRRKIEFLQSELNKKAASVLAALTGLCCDVYHYIIYQIISYLSNHDLHNLCDAANNTFF